jgi:hypothetical protein
VLSNQSHHREKTRFVTDFVSLSAVASRSYDQRKFVSLTAVKLRIQPVWNITIDQPYSDPSAVNLKHAVGTLFVGAPWEIVIPTKLVYLRNPKDLLPIYPLS